jgi:ADP-ribose pyrophosphatase
MAIVYKGRVFSLEVETSRFPNGTEHKVEIVRHAPCVVLVPFQDDGRVVLIRQYRPSVKRDLWELPAGSIDPGESPDAAAARECEEEVGLAPHRLERLASLFPAPGYCDEEDDLLPGDGLRPLRQSHRTSRTEDEDIR